VRQSYREREREKTRCEKIEKGTYQSNQIKKNTPNPSKRKDADDDEHIKGRAGGREGGRANSPTPFLTPAKKNI
jgi:hypothetical protein